MIENQSLKHASFSTEIQQEAQHRSKNDKRSTPITHQWQCNTHHRTQANNHGYIDHNLHGQNGHNPHSHQLAKTVLVVISNRKTTKNQNRITID